MARNALLLSLGLAGCGGGVGGMPSGTPSERLCDAETRADDFRVGLEKDSDGGQFAIRIRDSLFEGRPGPPDRGDNLLVVEVTGPDGAAAGDVEVRLRPWMPDHGHGTTPLIHPGRAAAGQFEFGPYFLHMGGFWELGMTVTDGEREETVTFGVCVEG